MRGAARNSWFSHLAHTRQHGQCQRAMRETGQDLRLPNTSADRYCWNSVWRFSEISGGCAPERSAALIAGAAN